MLRLFTTRLPVASLLLNATIIGKKMKREMQVAVGGGAAGAGAGEKEEVEVGQTTVMMTLSHHPTCLGLQAQHPYLISLTPK